MRFTASFVALLSSLLVSAAPVSRTVTDNNLLVLRMSPPSTFGQALPITHAPCSPDASQSSRTSSSSWRHSSTRRPFRSSRQATSSPQGSRPRKSPSKRSPQFSSMRPRTRRFSRCAPSLVLFISYLNLVVWPLGNDRLSRFPTSEHLLVRLLLSPHGCHHHGCNSSSGRERRCCRLPRRCPPRHRSYHPDGRGFHHDHRGPPPDRPEHPRVRHFHSSGFRHFPVAP